MAEQGGVAAVARKLHTSEDAGLLGERADLELRRRIYGPNLIPGLPSPSFLRVKIFPWGVIQTDFWSSVNGEKNENELFVFAKKE